MSGVSLSQLANMPSGSVVFDPEVVVQQGTYEVRDTYIYFKYGVADRATWNFGIATQLELWRSKNTNWQIERSMIDFDLSAIPHDATVNSATLGLYCTAIDASTTYPAPVSAYKMLTYWDEGTQDWAPGYACWNKPTSTTNWGAAGCQAGVDYVSTAEGHYTISSSVLNTWINFSIPTMTQEWVNNPSANQGVFIKLDRDGETNLSQYFYFASGEWSTVSQRPKLTVTYTESTPPEEEGNVIYYIRDAQGNVIATYKK